MRRRSPLDYLDRFVSRTAQAGLLHCRAEDPVLHGRTVRILGRDRIHFGSCSYLGLELDPRLKTAVHEAVDRYGTQFSSSRSYLSSPLYEILEQRLAEIFGGPVIVTPSTSLGHLAALPALVEREDALVMDHQVHHSVQNAVQVARREGCSVELVRHGHMQELTRRVEELAPHHRRVWVLGDGVYSMFGDLAPVTALWALAERIENLWLYVDDAHGMSWCGPRGCGSVLSRVPLRPRVIVATSLNKSFAAAGGCLVFGDPEARRRVFTVGGPMIFSGPVQPPLLGAAVASAELHLSSALPALHAELQERIGWATGMLRERELPLVATDATPIRFVGVGLPRVARNLAARLLEEGCFVNVSHFPAVPMKQAGIRFTVTRHHEKADLEHLADALHQHYEQAFRAEGQDPDAAWRSFGLEPPPRARSHPRDDLPIEIFESIEAIDRDEWDATLGQRGTYSWNGLHLLERCFGSTERPEEAWSFRYFLIRDAKGQLVLATFFTGALWKLDLLESDAVSREVERRRERDPAFLAAPVFAMGSLLTEGDHLYVDEAHLPPGSPAWEKALNTLLTRVREHAGEMGATWIVLRDLPTDRPTLEGFLNGQGFLRQNAPTRFQIPVEPSEEAQWRRLPSRHRRFVRREVAPWNERYTLSVLAHLPADAVPAFWRHLDGLYRQVHARSLELNTFPLPEGFFRAVLHYPECELLLLRERGAEEALPVAVIAAFRAPGRYCPLVLGMDYRLVRDQGLYRQCLRATLTRARALGATSLELGMGAGLQKRRLGALAREGAVFIQAEDHYALDVLAQVKAELGVGSA